VVLGCRDKRKGLEFRIWVQGAGTRWEGEPHRVYGLEFRYQVEGTTA
jgi:hypothetical protein